jgi:hypothetical protein
MERRALSVSLIHIKRLPGAWHRNIQSISGMEQFGKGSRLIRLSVHEKYFAE